METQLAFRKPSISPVWRASLVLAFAAALTSTWTGVNIAGIKLNDCLLVAGVAFVLIGAVSDGRRLPIYAWAVLPPLGLLIIALIGNLIRGDPLTVREEVTLNLVGAATVFNDSAGALPLIGRMLLSLTAVAIIVAGISENIQGGKVLVEKVMRTWALGAAISAAYCVLEKAGNFSILGNSSFLTHLADTRASGLANHPNSLGQTVVTALPMLIYMVGASRGCTRVFMIFSLPISMYAIFLSGSRAAMIFGTLFTVVTFGYLVISSRRISLWILPITIFLVPVGVIALPEILNATRFFNKLGQISDAMRLANLQRGVDLFNANPLFGAGVGSWRYEMVPLILLTSGGIVYFTIFYGSLLYPVIIRPGPSRGLFVAILLISTASVFAFGLLANGIVERYLYWPFAALFALSLVHSRQTDTEVDAVKAHVKVDRQVCQVKLELPRLEQPEIGR